MEFVSRDPASKRTLHHLERVARSDASVLIVGESGTGKELAAKYVHACSGRRGPFVAVNCGALTPGLAEAELFGHEAGSFTGATGARAGWFEAANGGTLLLDEIAELPAGLQVKILRVLQEREVTRVGSRRPIRIDVRLVAATNVDLGEAVAAGRFRVDLYYRLNVASVSLSPLRDRPADIVPLAEHFLSVYGERLKMPVPRLLPETQRALLAYGWPGNIRELENVIQAAMVVSRDSVIRPEHLRLERSSLETPNADDPGQPAPSVRDAALDPLLGPLDRLFQSPPAQLFPKVEELLVRRAYSHCHGNQVLAARLLGIPRNVMTTQLKRYGLLSSICEDSGAQIRSTAG
ncbi:MAG: sigma-54 dependent transcriptional regulator [Gammaproteobacteria bacterium]